jgi:hypothetical protein
MGMNGNLRGVLPVKDGLAPWSYLAPIARAVDTARGVASGVIVERIFISIAARTPAAK